MNSRHLSGSVLLIILTLIFAISFSLYNSVYTVRTDEVALIMQHGKITGQPQKTGLHLKVPFIQEVHKVPFMVIFRWDGDMSDYTTSDTKNIRAFLKANWKIIDAVKYFKKCNSVQRANIRMENILKASAKNCLNNFTLTEIENKYLTENKGKISVNQKLIKRIKDQSDERLEEFGIQIHSLGIGVITDKTQG